MYASTHTNTHPRTHTSNTNRHVDKYIQTKQTGKKMQPKNRNAKEKRPIKNKSDAKK